MCDVGKGLLLKNSGNVRSIILLISDLLQSHEICGRTEDIKFLGCEDPKRVVERKNQLLTRLEIDR